MKLSKFGGVCMATAENIKKSAEIIKQNNKRKIVVVSAPGQRFLNDTKITDRLYQCYHEVLKTGTCDNAFKEIEKHFLSIINYFNLTKYNDILKNIKKQIESTTNIDAIISKGEYLMAQIFADILNYQFVDAIGIIKFDNNNQLDKELTFKLTKEKLSKINTGVVIPGFYGSNQSGKIITFTRDGTDFTASLIATACEVSVYENWKDVEGIFSSNPSVIDNPKQIHQISYAQLRKLSYLGAKVVHPSTVLPVSEKNIPIEIKSFLNSTAKGTKITNKQTTNNFSPKAITAKSNLVLISLNKEMQQNETVFLTQLLSMLNNKNIALVFLKVDIDDIYLVISLPDYKQHEKYLLNQLKNMQLTNWQIDYIALISIIGNNICRKQRLIADIYTTLDKNAIDIKFIKVDGKQSFISLAIDDFDENFAINVLYDKIFA